jgi:hypothetical protein
MTARLWVADGGDGLQIWTTENIFNKQSRRADKGWYSSLGLTHHRKRTPCYETLHSLGIEYYLCDRMEDEMGVTSSTHDKV